MKKIEAWLSKKGLKNKRTLIVVIAFVLFIIFLFLLLNSNSEDSGNITITEMLNYVQVQTLRIQSYIKLRKVTILKRLVK